MRETNNSRTRDLDQHQENREPKNESWSLKRGPSRQTSVTMAESKQQIETLKKRNQIKRGAGPWGHRRRGGRWGCTPWARSRGRSRRTPRPWRERESDTHGKEISLRETKRTRRSGGDRTNTRCLLCSESRNDDSSTKEETLLYYGTFLG